MLKYEPSYLDWNQVTEWLQEIKDDNLSPTLPEEDLPLWLSTKWLKSLPANVVNDVWTEDEFENLIKLVSDAEKQLKSK